jgi:hypothetical protein
MPKLRMRRARCFHLMCTAAAVLVGVSVLHAQPTPLSTDSLDGITRTQLEQARDAVWRAWFAADSSALSQLLPAAVAAGSRSGWEDRGATLAAARRFVRGGGRLIAIGFDSTSIRLRGDVAVIQSRYTLVLQHVGGRSTQSGIATEVFVRERGRWTNPFWYLE